MRIVSGQANDFHPIFKRSRDRRFRICRRDKEHLRKVQPDFHKVVGEIRVEFRVEDFEHRARRIAPIVVSHLVDFVEQDDGIHAFRVSQRLDKAPGHRTDIRATVSADFRLVLHAAERHPGKVPAQRFRDRPHERRLSHARRPHQTDNRSLVFRTGLLQHGDIFENPLLDLFQAKMLRVQILLDLLQVQRGIRIDSIRNRKEPVDIVARDGIFRACGLHQAHPPEFLVELLLDSRRKALFLDFPFQLVDFVAIAIRNFALQHPNLLADEPILLVLLHFLLDIVPDMFHDAFHVESRLEIRIDRPSERIQVFLFERLLLLGRRHAHKGKHRHVCGKGIFLGHDIVHDIR